MRFKIFEFILVKYNIYLVSYLVYRVKYYHFKLFHFLITELNFDKINIGYKDYRGRVKF